MREPHVFNIFDEKDLFSHLEQQIISCDLNTEDELIFSMKIESVICTIWK